MYVRCPIISDGAQNIGTCVRVCVCVCVCGCTHRYVSQYVVKFLY